MQREGKSRYDNFIMPDIYHSLFFYVDNNNNLRYTSVVFLV